MLAWGKLRRDGDGRVVARLGLLEHCCDVAAVTAALLALPGIRRRLERLAGRTLDHIDLERLAALAFLHDIGKAAAGFQSKALDAAAQQAFLKSLGIHRDECGHTHVVAALFCDSEIRKRFANTIPSATIVSWDPESYLLLAAISHHGTPITPDDLRSYTRQSRNVWQSSTGYDPWETLAQLGDAVAKIFPVAFASSHRSLPDSPAFVHAFAGLVSLADWIGSNPTPGYFPYELSEGPARWPLALQRASAVLQAMRIDVQAMRDDLARRAPRFEDVFVDERTGAGFAPTDVQQFAGSMELDSLVAIEAETGSGKTEAALWRFKTLFEAGEVDALAFLLPTRVSAVQLYGRVQRFVERLFPDPALRPNVVLAVPGYLRVDGIDATGTLPGFQVLWPDSEEEGQAPLRWAAEHAKRYLAAACAVGTIDQALLAGLQVRHAHLRGVALLRSLLVVDEVHASDRYMARILRGLLQRQRSAGGHALLLSATLGVGTRCQLLNPEGVTQSLPEDARLATPYPCISDTQRTKELSGSGLRKHVRVDLRPCIDDPEAVAEMAAQAVTAGARVLVVKNTVAGALQVQRALEARLDITHPALFRCNDVVCPHHGRFAAEDRKRLDRAVEEAFGKGSAPGPRVLCGTQTLEQSLDIDADLLITDLAPMDVLLQRLGRLHRHADRVRPVPYGTPAAIVLTPVSRDLEGHLCPGPGRHGLGGRVYANLLCIDATWEQLERGELLIPDDNRWLVERCTDGETLRNRASIRHKAWTDHWQELEGRRLAATSQAAMLRLDWEEDWGNVQFPCGEERVRSRLGDESLRIPIPLSWISCFGAVVDELQVPSWLGVCPESVTSIDRVEGPSLRLQGQGFDLYYGRYGVQLGTPD